jgi:hypothetical protein
MIQELNEQDYKSTMRNGISDVTETAKPVLDIWPYVEMLVGEDIVSRYVLENFLVEKVYGNSDKEYDHILLPTAETDVFVVLVIDLNAQAIRGYHLLDLKKLYGIL